MGTSTVRFVVIVAFVVAGGVLIAQFPDASTSSLARTESSTPTPTATTNPKDGGQADNQGGDNQEPAPAPVEGVKLAVYNGTLETGLAAETALKLEQKKYGYKINDDRAILDAESKPMEQTTLYYVTPEDKSAAEALADGFFKQLDSVKIAKLPADLAVPPAGVQVAVYLGTDYATTR